MLRPGGAAGQGHLGDHHRATLREDEVVVRIRLALHAHEAGLDAEDARLERAARVLAARVRLQRAEIADGRGTDGEIDLPRPRIGERLDRPTLDAAERAPNDAGGLVLLPRLGSGSKGSAVTLARDEHGRERHPGDGDRRDDPCPELHRTRTAAASETDMADVTSRAGKRGFRSPPAATLAGH